MTIQIVAGRKLKKKHMGITSTVLASSLYVNDSFTVIANAISGSFSVGFPSLGSALTSLSLLLRLWSAALLHHTHHRGAIR